jgi:hypothetical protein
LNIPSITTDQIPICTGCEFEVCFCICEITTKQEVKEEIAYLTEEILKANILGMSRRAQELTQVKIALMECKN